MQIQSGKLYHNKTWSYLYPCLKSYGEELRKHLNNFIKLGVGIGDSNTKVLSEHNAIFILFDVEPILANSIEKENYKQNFDKFLDWISYQPYYVTDYIFEERRGKGKHMVVLRIPPKHDTTYLNFVRGIYSEMYTKKEIDEYFQYVTLDDKDMEAKRNEKITKCRQVLMKSPLLLPKFVKEVNLLFNTGIVEEDYKEAELDFPPTLFEEIFNYK